MCFGDELNTMATHECAALKVWAEEDFASHDFEVRTNADGVTWVVLEPPLARNDLLRFTICRITPCIMVMVEDADARRQFCSSGDVEGAMAFVRNMADRTILAAANAHPAHQVLQ